MSSKARRVLILFLAGMASTAVFAQTSGQQPTKAVEPASAVVSPNPADLVNSNAKRRQYVGAPPPVPLPIAAAPAYAPAGPELLAAAPSPPASAAGQCPGGPSLPVECDPKRPWPQCPPQSYCYATNSVDIGPYFCCPVWSTYGAAWRPATPFFDYAPPRPFNWPAAIAPPPSAGVPPMPYEKA